MHAVGKALRARIGLALAALFLFPGLALGQDGDPGEDRAGRARALFARGLACVEEHETACAEESFRQALALRDSPAIRYNLASALVELRRHPEAARLARSVVEDESAPAELRQHSQALLDQLVGEAGTLQIRLEGSTEGASVQVDGDPIPEAQRQAVLVAPGTRAVTALRGGALVAREDAQVERGAVVPVTLTIGPSPEELAAATSVDLGPAEPGIHEDWRFWAAVGGGVAAAVVVVVVVAVAAGGGGVEAALEGNYVPGVLRWE